MAEKTISELLASNEVTFEVLSKTDNSNIKELIYIKKISKRGDKIVDLTVRELDIVKKYNMTEIITGLVKKEVEKIYTHCSPSGDIFTLPKDEELVKIINSSDESGIEGLSLTTIKKILRKNFLPYFTIAEIQVVISDEALYTTIHSITFKTGKGIDDLVIHYDKNEVSSTNFCFTEDVGYSMIVEKSINLIHEKYKKIVSDKADHLNRVLAILTSDR